MCFYRRKQRISRRNRTKSERRLTLHLPDFERSHFIGAFNQVLPQLFQLFFQLWVNCPVGKKGQTASVEKCFPNCLSSKLLIRVSRLLQRKMVGFSG